MNKKLLGFTVGVMAFMVILLLMIALVVADDRAEVLALDQLHHEAIQGDPAALLAYCDGMVEEAGQGYGVFADCVARAQLEAFVTASAGGE